MNTGCAGFMLASFAALLFAVVEAGSQSQLCQKQTNSFEGRSLLQRKAQGSQIGFQVPNLRIKADNSTGSYYGDPRCPCIGIDKLPGKTEVTLENDLGLPVTALYPSSTGAHCEAWDDGIDPRCKKGGIPGYGKSWCRLKWCYVDPCNCAIDMTPELADYLPKATYQGKPLYLSLATCAGSSNAAVDDDKSKHPQQCSQKPVDETIVGQDGCRCIGISGIKGATVVNIDSQKVSYPADVGSRCSAWDKNVHPECTSKKPPAWCTNKWCYVDPCTCTVPGARISNYMPDTSVGNRSVYYSYATCGNVDAWNPDTSASCSKQVSQSRCESMAQGPWPGKAEVRKCAWGGKEMGCVNKELLDMCSVVFKVRDNKSWTLLTNRPPAKLRWKAFPYKYAICGGVFLALGLCFITACVRIEMQLRTSAN